MSGLIWIQTVWQYNYIPERLYCNSWFWRKSAHAKKLINFPEVKPLTYRIQHIKHTVQFFLNFDPSFWKQYTRAHQWGPCTVFMKKKHTKNGQIKVSVLCLLSLCARLFICALWSPAGKGLTSWLSFVVSNCGFVTFPSVSWVRCGTWLYLLLIFAPLLT